MDTLQLLKSFSEASGAAGHEDAVRAVLETAWSPWVSDLRTDALGNLIGLKHGSAPAPRRTIMVAVHMDEIGLIVTGFEGEFLRVHSLGGMDRRVLLGLEVTVHGRSELPGIIGNRPPHVLPATERNKIPPWQDLFIDLGLPPEQVQSMVRVGDHVTVNRPLVELKNQQVAAKAMDNRASIVTATLALEMLSQRSHAWDVATVATVQEEVGCKGAIVGAYALAPQLAIAIDVTFAKQHDDAGSGTFALGKGPTIGIGPNFHPDIVQRLSGVAQREEIPYEIEPVSGSSGTDAWSIQVAREGIPCGLICIPVRYMHQPVEVASLRDIERAARLLAAFIAGLQADYMPCWEDAQ